MKYSYAKLIALIAVLSLLLALFTACGNDEPIAVQTYTPTTAAYHTTTSIITTTTMTTTTGSTTTTRFPVDPAVITEKAPSTVYIQDGDVWVEQLKLRRDETEIVYDYYVDLLIADVLKDLIATYGYTEEEAEDVLYDGGLSIYSYENPTAQAAVEAVFLNEANFPDAGSWDTLNAGIFICDYDGHAVATVGGRGTKYNNRAWSLATDSVRQPGSTIKPIGVYAPALEDDLINYSTLAPNEPLYLSDGTKWPHNIGETVDMAWGYRTIEYAIQQSFNTIAVQVLAAYGANASYDFLQNKLRISTLDENDTNLAALGLGGMYYGVTTREMAAAYQVFGNGGYYNSPHTYHKVTCNDIVLLEHVAENDPVISAETATIMNKLLQNVLRNGTGSAIADDWPATDVFAKTGTTDGNRDSYFAAGTPYYVGAVWMGYEGGASMSDGQRAMAKEIWSQCMLALHADLPDASFDMWGDVVEAKYESGTGIVSENGTEIGYYKRDAIPDISNTFGNIQCSGNLPQATVTEPETTTTAPAA